MFRTHWLPLDFTTNKNRFRGLIIRNHYVEVARDERGVAERREDECRDSDENRGRSRAEAEAGAETR